MWLADSLLFDHYLRIDYYRHTDPDDTTAVAFPADGEMELAVIVMIVDLPSVGEVVGGVLVVAVIAVVVVGV